MRVGCGVLRMVIVGFASMECLCGDSKQLEGEQQQQQQQHTAKRQRQDLGEGKGRGAEGRGWRKLAAEAGMMNGLIVGQAN